MNEKEKWLEEALRHISRRERESRPLSKVITDLLKPAEPKKELIKHVDEGGQFIIIDSSEKNG